MSQELRDRAKLLVEMARAGFEEDVREIISGNDDLRQRANELLLQTTEAALLKTAGVDTAYLDTAIASSVQSLKAAGMIELSHRTATFAKRILSGALDLAFAALDEALT